MCKNPFWRKSLSLFWQRGPISYCFVIRFISVPFLSWLDNLGHPTISGIVTVLLAHFGSEDIEVFGNLSFHCVLHKTTPITKRPRTFNDTHHNDVRASAAVTFPLQSSFQCDFGMIVNNHNG